METANIRRRLDKLKAQWLRAKERVREERRALTKAKAELSNTVKAQQLIQRVAAAVQQVAHSRICAVVSQCLSIVFEDPFLFSIKFEKKRRKTEAYLSFKRRGLEVDPEDASFGAMIDVASFACRLAEIVLSKPAVRKLEVLDEPFRMLDEENSNRVGAMLTQLCIDLGVQIILVSHNKRIRVGKVIDLDAAAESAPPPAEDRERDKTNRPRSTARKVRQNQPAKRK